MPSQTQKLSLFLLCWLLGIFGVHNFLTGKYLAGGLQLSLLLGAAAIVGFEVRSLWVVGYVAVGVLLLWWFTDVVRIVAGRFRDRQGHLVTQWI